MKLPSGIVPDKVTFFLHGEDLHIDFIAADFGYGTVSDIEFIHFLFSYVIGYEHIFALSLIKRTIAAYPVPQGNIINYLF